MAGDITLKIDANTASYIGKIMQASEETKKHAEHVKSVGGQWQHANEHMARAVLKGTAIFEVIKAATEQMNKLAEKSAELSKGAGTETLERGRAFGTIGADEGTRALVESGQGGATNEERTQGLQALAGLKQEGKIPLSHSMVVRYLALMNTGLYKPDELIQMLRQGRPLPGDDDVAKRLESIGEKGRAELAVRSAERQAESRSRDATEESGRRVRAYNANSEAQRLEHPVLGAIQGTVDDIPIIGALTKTAAREVNSRLGRDSASGQSPVVEEIRRTNAILASHGKNLNLSGQSEP
jgi:hypothetical protein